jgi:hypothetical protein
MEILPVSKGTLAGWCREIQVTAEQAAAIRERSRSNAGVPRATQWRRQRTIDAIRREARAELLQLAKEPLWMAGTVMYWGEGSKTGGRLQLSNADPRALVLFRTWCVRHHDRAATFSAAVNLHDDNDVAAALAWWAEVLDLDPGAFTKPI